MTEAQRADGRVAWVLVPIVVIGLVATLAQGVKPTPPESGVEAAVETTVDAPREPPATEAQLPAGWTPAPERAGGPSYAGETVEPCALDIPPVPPGTDPGTLPPGPVEVFVASPWGVGGPEVDEVLHRHRLVEKLDDFMGHRTPTYGGDLVFTWEADTRTLTGTFRFIAPRPLTAGEVRRLLEDVSGQLTDGLGEDLLVVLPDGKGSGRGYGSTKLRFLQRPCPGLGPEHFPDWATRRLAMAVADGDLALVRRAVVEEGADPGAGNITLLMEVLGQPERTPALEELFVELLDHDRAAGTRAPELVRAASSGWTGAVRALLEKGVSPDARERHTEGRSALIEATRGDHLEVVDALLSAGATVDVRDHAGRTPLHHAKSEAVARSLVEAGADPSLVDEKGESVLDHHRAWREDTGSAAVLRVLEGR